MYGKTGYKGGSPVPYRPTRVPETVMRLYRRFITVCLTAFFGTFIFLGMTQMKYEQDQLDLTGDKPWGVNFHQQIPHRHSRDMKQIYGNETYVNSMKMLILEQQEKIKRLQLQQDNNQKQAVEYQHNQPIIHSDNNNNINLRNLIKNSINSQHSSSHNLTKVHVWPTANKMETEDRIIEQLYRFRPDVKGNRTIVLVRGPVDANTRLHSENCPVTACHFTSDRKQLSTADAVIYFNSVTTTEKILRPPHQIWALFMLESPHHASVGTYSNLVNWTATYRRDSVLVTPYEKFVYNDNFNGLPSKPIKDFSAGKTKKVAWFVSNCHAPNGRQSYVEELQKYIDVHIYGGCGTFKCSRKNKSCFEMLSKDYKFYLAFENSNCKDYITEKFYVNGLGNNILPIVMGARPEDYAAVAPPHSYIHVDEFASPQQLAEYLHKLDNDPDLYNSYFLWKNTGKFLNTKFWCRLCSLIHGVDDVAGRDGNSEDGGKNMAYKDMRAWWHGPGICVKPDGVKTKWSSWRNADYNDSFLLGNLHRY